MEPSSSVQAYSIVADLLTKFQSSPDWVKALWLVMMPVTVVGTAFCLLQAVKEIAAMLARREERHGAARELTSEETEEVPLPRLLWRQ